MKDTKMDLFWAILSTFLNAVMGIILLPVMLSKISNLDMGIWYVLSAIQSFILLLDLGFSPTFARNVSYAYSGVLTLEEKTFANAESGEPNCNLLYTLLKVSKKFYRIISLIALILLMSLGLWYYSSILYEHSFYLYSCYIVFTIALIINVYFSYIPTYMKGIGAINQQYKCYSLSRIVYIIVGVILLFCKLELLGVCIALLASGITLRVTCHFSLKKYQKEKNLLNYAETTTEYNEKTIFKTLSLNVKKEALITLSNFITSQSLTFFCTSYFGLEIESQYGLTIQVLNVISSLSFSYFSMSQSKISALQTTGDKEKIRVKFCKSICFFVLGYVCGTVLLVLLGEKILTLIGSNSHLLAKTGILLFAASIFLEKLIQLNCSYISTKNTLPYTLPFIITSAVILLFYAVLPKIFTSLPISSYAIVAMICYACYNLWRWRIYVSQDLKCKFILFSGAKYWFDDVKKIFVK